MFIKNNIEFRHATSERFVEFYRMRSLQLGQVLSTKRFRFSNASREVILQNYSTWIKFLQTSELELVKSGEYVSKSASQAIANALAQTSKELLNIITVNTDVFPRPYARLYSKIIQMEHAGLKTRLRKSLDVAEDCKVPIIDYFTLICSTLKNYMNHTLFVVHEIDNVIRKSESHFISIDRFDLNLKAQGIDSPSFRYTLYRNAHDFGVDITLKDYAETDLSQAEARHKSECIRKLVAAGASIVQTQ